MAIVNVSADPLVQEVGRRAVCRAVARADQLLSVALPLSHVDQGIFQSPRPS